MKRKIGYIVVAIVMLIASMFNVETLYADKPVTIEVSSEKAVAGEKVTVYVSIADSTGYAGIQFDVNFDNKVLTLESAKGITDNIKMEPTIQEKKSSVTYVAAEANNHKGNGQILELVFMVAADAKAGETEIKLSEEMVVTGDLEILNTKLVTGKVTISNDGDISQGEDTTTDNSSVNQETETEENYSPVDDEDVTTEKTTENASKDDVSEGADENEPSDKKTDEKENNSNDGSLIGIIVVCLIIVIAIVIVILKVKKKK